MSGLRYVYGIVPAAAAAAVDAARVSGIDDAPVRALVEGAFAAAESELDTDDYGAESLNQKIRDMEWLTPRAEAHQAVNSRLLDIAGVVLPLSFGAIYRDETRVREMLREDVAARRERLDGLVGKAEWVVTLLRDREHVATGGPDIVVVRVSVLAPTTRAASVGDAIASLGRELADDGYHVRSNGPWPAYRFGSLP